MHVCEGQSKLIPDAPITFHILIIIIIYDCFACIYICEPYVCPVPKEVDELTCGSWELNLGSLQGQQNNKYTPPLPAPLSLRQGLTS